MEMQVTQILSLRYPDRFGLRLVEIEVRSIHFRKLDS